MVMNVRYWGKPLPKFSRQIIPSNNVTASTTKDATTIVAKNGKPENLRLKVFVGKTEIHAASMTRPVAKKILDNSLFSLRKEVHPYKGFS